MSEQFDWIEPYKAIAQELLKFKDNRTDLLELLKRLRSKGLLIIPLTDRSSKDDDSKKQDLEDIDPFTFFSNFNRGITHKNRHDIIAAISDEWNLSISMRDSFLGIPTANNQKSWYVSYKYERKSNDIDLLWDLFERCLENNVDSQLFDDCLNIKSVGLASLTMCMYWVAPDHFLPLDANSVKYLKHKFGINFKINNNSNWEQYNELLSNLKDKTDDSFYKISLDAWSYLKDTRGKQYFLVEAYWNNRDDKTAEFVAKGIWQNGFADRYLEEIKKIKENDSIAIKSSYTRNRKNSVMMIKARGTVIENKMDGTNLVVDWEKDFSPFEVPVGGHLKTISLLSKQDQIDTIFNDKKEGARMVKDAEFCNNTILYGPPGTGKTYNTINYALKIADPKFYDLNSDATKESRKALVKRFQELNKSGQIVFTTFHQSMCYEDFIEGIKPQEPEEDKDCISYRVVDGIFKTICSKAEVNFEKNADSKNSDQRRTIKELVDEFSESVQLEIEQNDIYKLNDNVNIIQVEEDAFRYTGPNWIRHSKGLRLKFVDVMEMLNNNVSERKDIKQLDNISGLAKQHATYAMIIIEKIREFEEKNPIKHIEQEPLKNYVLIIDEINRGNVSAIFGELITLIEDDKRIGRDEALKVTLPYSKTPFGVPSNLYIIGTMNTADRSVEALDSALRRRFSFTEMPSDPEIVRKFGKMNEDDGKLEIGDYEVDLVELLKIINKRIEILLDKDHMIGHSYFMQVDDSESLKEAFSRHIIPLLQEYFYGDYGKIALVLGKGFCKGEKIVSVNNIFADVEEYETSAFDDRIIYSIQDVMSNDSTFIEALKTLINNKAQEQPEK